MEESTLRWPTDKEREEMEEVCSRREVPHTEKAVSDFDTGHNAVLGWGERGSQQESQYINARTQRTKAAR